MSSLRHHRNGIAWLKLLFALAIVILIVQIYPGVLDDVLWAIDIRNWTRVAWFLVNLAVVGALVAIRFGPEAAHAWRNHRMKAQSERNQRNEIAERKRERNAIEQIKQSRSRRLY
jgi:hypothetical protein